MNISTDITSFQAVRPLFSQEFVNRVKKIDSEKKEIRFQETPLQTAEDLNEFKEVLDVANEVFFGSDMHYEFQVHEKTGTVMSRLINTETGETVREIPSEKLLDMIAGLWEIAGVIIDDHA